jgi:hypothetical protein
MDEPGPTSISLIYLLLFNIFLYSYYFKRIYVCNLFIVNLQTHTLTTSVYIKSSKNYTYYNIENLLKNFLFIYNRWNNIRIILKNPLYILFN